MMMSLSRFRTHLLEALYAFLANSEFDDAFLADCAEQANLFWMSGWIEHSAERLESDGYIEMAGLRDHPNAPPGDPDFSIRARITDKGVAFLSSEPGKQSLANMLGMWDFSFPNDSTDWFMLAALLAASVNQPEDEYLTPAQITEMSGENLDLDDLRNRLVKFGRCGLIKDSTGRHFGQSSEHAALTPHGIWFVIRHSPSLFDLEQWPHATQLSSEMVEAIEQIWEWNRAFHEESTEHHHMEQGASNFQPAPSIPASDRVVSLNHNSPQHVTVVEKLEELKDSIEANNEYRVADIEDHERRLADVESTLKLLEARRVRVGTIQATAYGTLVYLAEKFSEGPIGELAKVAWELLKAYIGL